MGLFVLGDIIVSVWSRPLHMKEKVSALVLGEAASQFPCLSLVYVGTAALAHARKFL